MTPAALVAELHEAGVEVAAPKEPGTETVELADMVRSLRLRKNAVGLVDTHRAVAVAAVQKKAFQLFQAEIDFLASLNKIGEVLQGFEPDKRSTNLYACHFFLFLFVFSCHDAFGRPEITSQRRR